jgi:RNA polymerase sigma-70 factor (ECF subfamily)
MLRGGYTNEAAGASIIVQEMTDALAIETPADEATLDAIERVYRDRGSAFLRVATAITGERAAAHDAVQEGFALAIRHRRRYRGDGPLEAWIWRLVVNAARSHRRKRTPAPAADVGDRAAPAPDDAGQLHALVAGLPERQRLAVFLRYYADLDYAAIGTALGVRTGTVSATLAAGIRSLRRMAEEVEL